MIHKKLARKTASFRELMEYAHERKVAPPILYNLPSRDQKEVLREFEANARLVKKRKNGNYLYHEILSFHRKDAPSLKYHMIQDLTLKYLDLRTRGKGLAYAAIHWGSNPHVHIMLAANELGKSRKLDLTNTQFRNLRREIEAYQKRRYPCLEHSIVFDGRERKRRSSKTTKEGERERRLKKESAAGLSEKEEVRKLVHDCLTSSVSEEEFKKNLRKNGLEFYRRSAKTFGVKRLGDNGKYRKFRLKTLGLGELYDRTSRYWRNRPKMEEEFSQARRRSRRIEKTPRLTLGLSE